MGTIGEDFMIRTYDYMEPGAPFSDRTQMSSSTSDIGIDSTKTRTTTNLVGAT
jgi:hypothetical protein